MVCVYLSSLVEVNKATSYVVWVAIGNEGEVLQKDTNVRNSWDWCDAELITIVLVVTLRGMDSSNVHYH